MKFKGTPNLLVRLMRPIGNIRHIRFDAQGFYETENERLIKRLQHKFEMVTEETKEAAKEEDKVFACKKCTFTTPDRVELMTHYRKVHPKKKGAKKK